MADNPKHYHAIQNVTKAWQDFVKGVRDVATDTADERARAQREETKREVHNTGRPHSQKGG